jgi:hypothetical protein
MRKSLAASAGLATLLALPSTAQAGTYIPVPMVDGAVSEIVFAINNHNVVAGSFRDSGNVEHGFFGPLDGSKWTVFDFPGEGTTGTEARHINDHGAITGIALNPQFEVGQEFYRTPGGTFKTFRANGRKLDGIAQGLNASGASVGDYLSAEGKTVGYTGQSGAYSANFTLHLHGKGKFPQVSPRGIDDIEQVTTGFFTDQNGFQHGFEQTHVTGHIYEVKQVDYPGAKATALEDIYGTGQWTDSDGSIHAFIINFRNHKGPFIDLNPDDGSTSQQAWGGNKHGLVALSTNIGRSYIYCPRSHPEKCPSTGLPTKPRRLSGTANSARP